MEKIFVIRLKFDRVMNVEYLRNIFYYKVLPTPESIAPPLILALREYKMFG